MTFPVLAGEARRYYQAKLVRHRIYTVCVALVLVGLLGVEVKSYVARSKATATPTASVAAAPPKSFAAKQVIDVNILASAIGQFVSANGALPSSLYPTPDGKVVLCSSFCNAALYAVGDFGVYQVANIKMVSYSANLATTDPNAMLLVRGAACGGKGHIGAPSSKPRAMAILYAASTDTGTESRCIVL